jgi:hypothetical protein
MTVKSSGGGFAPSFSAQVRSHGKPGQVGEPGAPVLTEEVLWV